MAKYYITMVSQALYFGSKAFAGKYDKTGMEPAFLHSIRVCGSIKKAHGGEVLETAALLHDVIEDTAVTVDDLRQFFDKYPTEKVEEMVAIILSVTRGYTHRETRAMVFSPPPAGEVCDCKSRKCAVAAHIYDKEMYRDFVMRSKRHPKGRILKIADITDNMSPERVGSLPEAERGIAEERYVPALAFLKDGSATEYFTPRQLARLCVWCSKPFGEHEGQRLRLCPVATLLFPAGERPVFKGVR
jgi:(p)ppGpp synthase/HD superfamily hydrolase